MVMNTTSWSFLATHLADRAVATYPLLPVDTRSRIDDALSKLCAFAQLVDEAQLELVIHGHLLSSPNIILLEEEVEDAKRIYYEAEQEMIDKEDDKHTEVVLEIILLAVEVGACEAIMFPRVAVV